MKICFIYVCLSLFLISCKKNDLSTELKKEVVEYQKKVPLPSVKNEETSKFLYVINFEKKGNDTLFNLIRCPGISKFDSITGIYQDDVLKPLVIIDRHELGKNWLYLKKDNGVNNFIINNLHSIEDYPPLYKYRIKNKKIILIKIDTISYNWIK